MNRENREAQSREETYRLHGFPKIIRSARRRAPEAPAANETRPSLSRREAIRLSVSSLMAASTAVFFAAVVGIGSPARAGTVGGGVSGDGPKPLPACNEESPNTNCKATEGNSCGKSSINDCSGGKNTCSGTNSNECSDGTINSCWGTGATNACTGTGSNECTGANGANTCHDTGSNTCSGSDSNNCSGGGIQMNNCNDGSKNTCSGANSNQCTGGTSNICTPASNNSCTGAGSNTCEQPNVCNGASNNVCSPSYNTA